MKYFFVFLLLLGGLRAEGKHKYRGLPRTEVGLMNNLLGCLQYKDTASYFSLFPPFDTLWQLVMHNPDHSPEIMNALAEIKEHPRTLLEFDPAYNPSIMARFAAVLRKGEDSGIHWSEIVLQRYELSRMVITHKELAGYNAVAPERFKGYVFVRDLLGRLTFCITITEIQKIRGFFFGGQLENILEASGIEEYLVKEQREKKYFEYMSRLHTIDSMHDDSVKNGLIDTTDIAKADTVPIVKKPVNPLAITAIEEDSAKTRKEVVDRKYYEGKFDDEIPVKLFVRYMKNLRTGTVSEFDGLYKFGDQENYVKLIITRTPDGKWTMEDDPPIATLELELKDKVYTGAWTNNESQNGYDVVLKQTDIPQKKLEKLDKMLETGIVGRIDDDITEKKDKPKPKDNEDEGY